MVNPCGRKERREGGSREAGRQGGRGCFNANHLDEDSSHSSDISWPRLSAGHCGEGRGKKGTNTQVFLQETPGHKPKKAQTLSQACIQEREARQVSVWDPEGQGHFKGSISTWTLTQIQALKLISTQPESPIAAKKSNSLRDP